MLRNAPSARNAPALDQRSCGEDKTPEQIDAARSSRQLTATSCGVAIV